MSRPLAVPGRLLPSRRKLLTRRRLIALLGAEVACAIMQEWEGHRIPRLTVRHRARAERDRRIVEAVLAGHTHRTIAAAEGITPERVCQIRARQRELLNRVV